VKIGVYNKWVDKSFGKLAKLVPARYAKSEDSSGYVETFNRQLAFDALTERREPVRVAALVPQPVQAQAEPAVQPGAPEQTQTPRQEPPSPQAEGDKAAKSVPSAPAPAAPKPVSPKKEVRK
jgi:hypothetical protein